MNADDLSNNIINKLRKVKQSKSSIAEAMHQLDVVIQMGNKIEQVCSNQHRIDNDFGHILQRLDAIATVPAITKIVDCKLNEF